jgi:hypothetical protein
MASIDFDIRGLRGANQTLEQYRKEAHSELKNTIRDQTRQVQNNAKLGAPEDTGNLMASIKVDFRALDRLYAEVYSALEYAAAQEFGFTGTVEVSAHRRTMTEGFGPESEYPKIVEVQAHTRKMDIPGQYYFTSAAKFQEPRFKQSIIAALFRARNSAAR